MKKLVLLSLVLAVFLAFAPAATAADTIPVGVPIPMTGWAAGSGADYFKGIKMAIDEINAAGGVLGRPLKFISADTGSDIAQGAVDQALRVAGGVGDLVVDLHMREEQLADMRETAVRQSERTITNRIDTMGVLEPTVIARPTSPGSPTSGSRTRCRPPSERRSGPMPSGDSGRATRSWRCGPSPRTDIFPTWISTRSNRGTWPR